MFLLTQFKYRHIPNYKSFLSYVAAVLEPVSIYNGIMTEVELNEGSFHMMNLLKYAIQQYTGQLFLWPDYISYISYLKADI